MSNAHVIVALAHKRECVTARLLAKGIPYAVYNFEMEQIDRQLRREADCSGIAPSVSRQLEKMEGEE